MMQRPLWQKIFIDTKYYNGNYSLRDISPKKLFKVLIHQLELTERNKFLANLNLEPKINNIEGWKIVKEFYKKTLRDLELDRHFFDRFLQSLGQKSFLKNLRKL